MAQYLPWKVDSQWIPGSYGTQRCVPCSQNSYIESYFEPIEFSPQSTSSYQTSSRSILILSFFLCPVFWNSLFHRNFPTRILQEMYYFSHTCYMSVRFIHYFNISEEYKLRSSKLWNFLQPLVISSFSEPNILLGTLFSNTLNMASCTCTTLYSHMYRRVLILCNIFQFFHSVISRKWRQQDW